MKWNRFLSLTVGLASVTTAYITNDLQKTVWWMSCLAFFGCLLVWFGDSIGSSTSLNFLYGKEKGGILNF